MGTRPPAIFCIEGEWSPNLADPRSVRPLLETLKSVGKIDFIHRSAITADAFRAIAGRWSQKQYEKYTVGYFALHGSPGAIHLGRENFSLEELGELLAGKCQGRTLYFGACSTLEVEEARLEAFRRTTGGRVVIGYSAEIDWLESAAFDLLLLEAISHYRRADALESWLRGRHGQFADRLGLRIHYRGRKPNG